MGNALRLKQSAFFARWFVPVVVVTSVLAFAASAPAIVIDDFTNPNLPDTYIIWPGVYDPDPYVIQSTVAGVVGGERDFLIDVADPAVPLGATGVIGTGSYSFASGRNGAMAVLQYDGEDVDPAQSLVNSTGLDEDLTDGGDSTGIRFYFASIDGAAEPALDISIYLTSSGGGGSDATLSDLIPESPAGATEYFVSFADFTTSTGFQFEQVTSIEVTFNSRMIYDVDFELDLIETDVPEPTTLALLPIGLLACSRRRRRPA